MKSMPTIFRWSCFACGARWRVQSWNGEQVPGTVKSVKITTTGAGCPVCRDTAANMSTAVEQENEEEI
jgi:hypothetical protein